MKDYDGSDDEEYAAMYDEEMSFYYINLGRITKLFDNILDNVLEMLLWEKDRQPEISTAIWKINKLIVADDMAEQIDIVFKNLFINTPANSILKIEQKIERLSSKHATTPTYDLEQLAVAFGKVLKQFQVYSTQVFSNSDLIQLLGLIYREQLAFQIKHE